MQTENTKHRINRTDDDRNNDGSRITGVGCGTGYKDGNGYLSPAQNQGQNTTREMIGKPHEEETKAMERGRTVTEYQTKTTDRTGTLLKERIKTMDQTGALPEGQRTSIDPIVTLPEASGNDPGPGRSKRPFVAIREAQRRAAIWGFTVADVVSSDDLPYDFIAMKDGITSFVRVRRIRDSWFDSKRVQDRCRNEITGFRAMEPQPGLIFELWIRGYARAFHRYRILPDAIEKIGMILEPETRAGKEALDEEQRAVTLIPHHNHQETMAGETVPAIPDPASP